MVDSHCGLHCTGCSFIQTHGCGGCIATEGHPFHGTCSVALCCIGKGHDHCGQCSTFPCALLCDYSCDPQHGDDPHGQRIRQCLHWREAGATRE